MALSICSFYFKNQEVLQPANQQTLSLMVRVLAMVEVCLTDILAICGYNSGHTCNMYCAVAIIETIL